MARAGGFHEGMAIYTGNLAELNLDRKDWPTAEILAREALLLAEDLGRQEVIASNGYRLARALVRQGKAAEALPHARRAVDIFIRIGSHGIRNAQLVLAECEGGGAVE